MGFWAIWHSGTSWPSGHLGPPGSSDTSEMTLWHAGTLMACWHSRQTHGIGRLMMIAQPSHSGRLQTHKQEWSDQFLRLMQFMMYLDLSQNTQNWPNPHKPKIQPKMSKNWKIEPKWPKTGLWVTHTLVEISQITGIVSKFSFLGFFFLPKMAWKLDISDLDIPLRLSTWLDTSVEPPCVIYE